MLCGGVCVEDDLLAQVLPDEVRSGFGRGPPAARRAPPAAVLYTAGTVSVTGLLAELHGGGRGGHSETPAKRQWRLCPRGGLGWKGEDVEQEALHFLATEKDLIGVENSRSWTARAKESEHHNFFACEAINTK